PAPPPREGSPPARCSSRAWCRRRSSPPITRPTSSSWTGCVRAASPSTRRTRSCDRGNELHDRAAGQGTGTHWRQHYIGAINIRRNRYNCGLARSADRRADETGANGSVHLIVHRQSLEQGLKLVIIRQVGIDNLFFGGDYEISMP